MSGRLTGGEAIAPFPDYRKVQPPHWLSLTHPKLTVLTLFRLLGEHMARPRSPRPTDVETQILTVLWEKGESSVRDVHLAVNKTKKTAYSSVATIMRIMDNKGWVTLTDVKRPQKFKAAISEEALGRTLMDDLASRVFGGSIATLVRHALTGRKRSASEIAELRKLLEELK